MAFKSKLMALGVVASLGMIGCGGGEDNSGNNSAQANNSDSKWCQGKCDDIDGPPACEGSVVHFANGQMGADEINALNDPFARKVLRAGDACPSGFDEVMDKLRALDNEGCEGERDGVKSMLVSESAQIMDTPTNYRVVVSRACEEEGTRRPDHGIMFSLFGVRAVDDPENPPSLPQTVEVMAFDESAGIFNYYEAHSDGEIEFFGSSTDIIEQNAGLATGVAGRCAGCHNGGGVVMKELDTPWVHWEGHHDIPGARELVDAYPNLGSKSSGSTMERITKRANERWNETRVAHMQFVGTARTLLEPLFCSPEVNLDNGADFERTKDVKIGKDFLLDPRVYDGASFSDFRSITIEAETYEAALEKSGSFVSPDGFSELKDDEGNVVRDTIFRFTYVERAHIDDDYLEKLVEAGVLDAELVADVVNVDFTRPVFSDGRCALLEHVPELAGADTTADAVRDGMIASLEAIEQPNAFEAELLENLTNEEATAEAHQQEAKDFMAACEMRPKEELIDDVLTIAAMRRARARDMRVFEFPMTMVFDALRVDGSERLDPETCELITD